MPPSLALFVQYDAQVGGSPISGSMVVKALMDAGWRVDAVFASDGPMAQRYEQLGCRIHVLPHGQWLRGGSVWQRARRWGRELAVAGRFARLMRTVKPDLVYVNTITGLAAVAAARLLRIPSIWHIRELFDDVGGEMHAPLGGKALARWAVARLPSRVVAISQAVAENVLGANFPGPLDATVAAGEESRQPNHQAAVGRSRKSPRVVVIPNAVSDRFFEEQRSAAECRAMFGLPGPYKGTTLVSRDVDRDCSPPNPTPSSSLGATCSLGPAPPLIGVPGTLRPVKGHEFFFHAARLVRDKLPECRFAVTGTGQPDYRARLEAQVAQAGLKDCTHFLGSVEDMPAFYRACDVICVPSRSEPFGRTVIESFAAGTPVVAAAVGGMRETIEHEKTGLLVDYGDVEGLSSALLGLLADRLLARRLATAARQEASKSYCEEVYQERICRVVEELIVQK